MSSPNDVTMEEILLEDNEQDSIEYRILMAYAQRKLPASKYKKLLKNETKVLKTSSVIRSEDEIQPQGDKSGPSQTSELQHDTKKQKSKKHPKQNFLSRYCLPLLCSRGEQLSPTKTYALNTQMEDLSTSDTCTERPQNRSFQEQSEKADVSHIVDKLSKLVTTRSQPSPSDVTFKMLMHTRSLEQDGRDTTDENEGEGNDEEKTIQTIVALLRKSGDQLEEKFKKDRSFYQRFEDMLSYAFFERLTDLFLENVSADSTNETEDQLQCTKVAFTLEVATRLTAVDNHPMNLVMGFGLKYLQEHFSPWIRDRGGWDKALSSLDQEEVE
ncbi:apoptosis facilitator Bcl-2-like protein 14 [Gallus gallus]|uniref:apoptosis facilitator Bcl-2-like protein 14 n=1 Tax=Gallus gallus TaxID=9031 RepID=UPI001AE160E4|nr:apoptosis facilitator Bcl-2-like protein 14 [Gallus gallus]XP_046766065.1 apoptosis facilitator Bcl-2-like protein 14 [Gallus gallus]